MENVQSGKYLETPVTDREPAVWRRGFYSALLSVPAALALYYAVVWLF